MSLTVDGATGGAGKRYDGLGPVGFAEIGIPGVGPAAESLRLPTDLLDQAGAASLGHPLFILMNRSRVTEPPRQDPEPVMARSFVLPTARTFAIGGTAEVNAGDSDYLINQLVGLTPAAQLPSTPAAGDRGPAVVIAANSSTRLDEDRQARANAAVDGNDTSAWIAETGPQAGEWLSFSLSRPITIDHLNLQVINDGRHSLPTRITIGTEDGASRVVDLPEVPVGNGRPQGSTTTIPITFPALTGTHIKVTVDAVHQVRALDYYATFSGATDILPVGIAELGLPVVQPALPATLPATCQAGLLRIDGQPVDVEVTGTTSAALGGEPLNVRGCGNAAAGIHLSAGTHLVQTSPRLPTGWSIDQLALAHRPAGVAAEDRRAGDDGCRRRRRRLPPPADDGCRRRAGPVSGPSGPHLVDRDGAGRRTALLAGPRPEPERRLVGVVAGWAQSGPVTAGRWLCQRLVCARRPRQRADGHPPDVDPPARRVGGDRRVCGRAVGDHGGRGDAAGRPPAPAPAASPASASTGGTGWQRPLPRLLGEPVGDLRQPAPPVPGRGRQPRVGVPRRRGQPARDRSGGRDGGGGGLLVAVGTPSGAGRRGRSPGPGRRCMRSRSSIATTTCRPSTGRATSALPTTSPGWASPSSAPTWWWVRCGRDSAPRLPRRRSVTSRRGLRDYKRFGRRGRPGRAGCRRRPVLRRLVRHRLTSSKSRRWARCPYCRPSPFCCYGRLSAPGGGWSDSRRCSSAWPFS